MCTSIHFNGDKTLVGWNLDLSDMRHRVVSDSRGVLIEILDKTEGWMPVFGANPRGDFVGMPTCWPYDQRSDPSSDGRENVILLDIDLLLMKKTLREVREIAEQKGTCSVPGVTFMPSLSDREGNVLEIVPGQGTRYFEKPRYAALTNFSPFKMDRELHPWMGLDRYRTAETMLKAAPDDFGVNDCFAVLKACSQTLCPTVVSMVYDVKEQTVYWCENRAWDQVEKRKFKWKR